MREKMLVVLSFAAAIFTIFAILTPVEAGSVRGYFKRDGTYVQPHYRSNPDGNPYNNYSYPGNYNPNTGRTSTGNEDTYRERYYERKNSRDMQRNYRKGL